MFEWISLILLLVICKSSLWINLSRGERERLSLVLPLLALTAVHGQLLRPKSFPFHPRVSKEGLFFLARTASQSLHVALVSPSFFEM